MKYIALITILLIAFVYLIDLIMMHAWWVSEGRWMDDEDLELDLWDGIIPFRWKRNKR